MDEVWNLLLSTGVGRVWLEAVGVLAAVGLGFHALHLRWRHSQALNQQRNVAQLIDHLSEGVYRSTLDGRQLSANKALVKLNGYDTEAEMLAAVKDIAVEWYVETGRRDEFRVKLEREGVVEDFVSEIYRHKTREKIWISESARIVYHPRSGQPLYYEGSVREITETFQKLNTEKRFRKLTSAVPGVLFQCAFTRGSGFSIPYISDGFAAMTGLAADKVRADGAIFLDCIHPDDRVVYEKSLRVALRSASPWDQEFRFKTPSGIDKWFRISGTIERNGDTSLLHAYMNDISVRRRQAIEIEKLAFFDPLTSLPNRRLLADRLADAIAACQARGQYGALLYIDLDNFKALNDTQGHDIGDEYLIQVSQKLTAAAGVDNTVARIGGDEFIVILSDINFDLATGVCEGIEIAKRMLADLSSNFHLGVVQHQSSASIGFVVFDGTPVRVEDLLKRADMAMYEAKSSGRNNIAVFDPQTLERETERYKLIGDLRFAISEHRFELVLRPQQSREGVVVGAQSCVRWPHPKRGHLSFNEFSNIATKLGLAEDLGRVVLTMAAGTLKRWQGNPATSDLRLTVNFDLAALLAPDFVSWLEALVQRTGIDPSRLTLGLHERLEEDQMGALAQAMFRIRRIGLRFRLDRYGSGGLSPIHLKRLPFDEVRLQHPLVSEVAVGHYDRAIAGHLIAMASSLGLTVVVDDIESAEQHEILALLGGHRFQGSHYGALVPESEFTQKAIAETEIPAVEPEFPLRSLAS